MNNCNDNKLVIKNISRSGFAREAEYVGDLMIIRNELFFKDFDAAKRIFDLHVEFDKYIIINCTFSEAGENYRVNINDRSFTFIENRSDAISQYNQIKAYYQNYNLENQSIIELYQAEREEKIKNKIDSIEENIRKYTALCLEDRDIKNIIIKFIEVSNFDIFYKIDNLVQLEKNIKRTYDDDFSILSIYYSKLKGNPKEIFEDINVVEFKKKYFDNLVKLLKKRFQLPSKEIGDYVSLNLLYKYFEEYSSNLVENNLFGRDIDKLNLFECVDEYINTYRLLNDDDIIKGRFLFFLIKHSKFKYIDKTFPTKNYIECSRYFNQLLLNKLAVNEENDFEFMLLNTEKKPVKNYSIDDIDMMNGYEFEEFVAKLFDKMGYSAKVTKSSGDQGVDIIVKKNGDSIGIQAKNYSNKVSNSAIQEIVAGMNYYRLNKAMVITNNYFTDSAKSLAHSNNVILWDREILKIKIKAYL